MYTAETLFDRHDFANDIARFNAFQVALSHPSAPASTGPFAFPRPSRAFLRGRRQSARPCVYTLGPVLPVRVSGGLLVYLNI